MKCKLFKKQIISSAFISGFLTIFFLFLINGMCIDGRRLRDMIIIFSSMMMVMTTASFMVIWIMDVKQDK
jgi:hypothetical protein